LGYEVAGSWDLNWRLALVGICSFSTFVVCVCGLDLTRMQPEKSSRMDTGELKAQLVKKVGPERFKKYFYFLNRFINQKLSKSDFDKSCYRILGRENLPLHNQIIRAILRNACSAKAPPPPVHDVGPAKLATAAGRSSTFPDDGHGQALVPGNNHSAVAPIWSNGVVLPMSPRKVRSGMRDRKFKDRPSPLGPNGKADSASHQSTATEDSGAKTAENGDLIACDYRRTSQQPRGLAEQPESEERLLMKPADVVGFIPGKDQNNIAAVEDGEEVEQANHLKLSQRPLLAPLGIPFCSASSGGARKALPVTSIGDYVTLFDNGGLYDSETLRRRMEQIAVVQGLEGVSLECANTLNSMLDVYLKRLVRSCVQLVAPRSAGDTTRHHVQKQQINGKPINGVWPSNYLHMQSGGSPLEDQRVCHSISLHDFKTAMELDPQQLGEDWPSVLERISMQAFKE